MGYGATYWDYETYNGGWWDPGGYWYTGSPVQWSAHFPISGVPAGEGVSRLRMQSRMGDLGDGQYYNLLAQGVTMGSTGWRGGCGVNQFGGAADCGWAVVVDWQAADPSQYLKAFNYVVGLVTPASSGNQQHYLFAERLYLEWWSAPLPKRRPSMQPI